MVINNLEERITTAPPYCDSMILSGNIPGLCFSWDTVKMIAWVFGCL